MTGVQVRTVYQPRYSRSVTSDLVCLTTAYPISNYYMCNEALMHDNNNNNDVMSCSAVITEAVTRVMRLQVYVKHSELNV